MVCCLSWFKLLCYASLVAMCSSSFLLFNYMCLFRLSLFAADPGVLVEVDALGGGDDAAFLLLLLLLSIVLLVLLLLLLLLLVVSLLLVLLVVS